MLDTLNHAHRRPCTLATVVGAHGSIQGGEGGVGIQQRRAADVHALVTQLHRALHAGKRAVPHLQLAIDQVFTLLNGRRQAKLLGNLRGGGGKQLGEQVAGGHVATPGIVAKHD